MDCVTPGSTVTTRHILQKKSDIWYPKTSRAFEIPIHTKVVLLAAILSQLAAL